MTKDPKDLRPMTWADLGFWYSDHWDRVQMKMVLEQTCPTIDKVFRALTLTPMNKVKVVILGQDPYPNPDMATGLAFSVPKLQSKLPVSLQNMLEELKEDIGCTIEHGCLDSWAQQGVLLLNRCLSCRAYASNSHKGIGWEVLTDEIIEQLSRLHDNIVWVLLGKEAQEVQKLLDWSAMKVMTSHPSPMSAAQGFVGSRIFSKINTMLKETNQTEIDWSLTFDGP